MPHCQAKLLGFWVLGLGFGFGLRFQRVVGGIYGLELRGQHFYGHRGDICLLTY